MHIIQKLISAYKLWNDFRDKFPKKSRNTLGAKIDKLFLELADHFLTASYLDKKSKLPILQKADRAMVLLKFFLQLAWDVKALDNKKYVVLSKNLDEVGKMLGGLIKGLQN